TFFSTSVEETTCTWLARPSSSSTGGLAADAGSVDAGSDCVKTGASSRIRVSPQYLGVASHAKAKAMAVTTRAAERIRGQRLARPERNAAEATSTSLAADRIPG